MSRGASVEDEVRRSGAQVAPDYVDRLFVYGTLRTGSAANAMLVPHQRATEPATTHGRIVAFEDGYPGLVDDPSATVIGEMVTLSDLAATFALLDAYEGQDFARVLRKITLADGREVDAWCYVLARPELAASAEPITDGDWLRYAENGS